MHHKDMWLGDK